MTRIKLVESSHVEDNLIANDALKKLEGVMDVEIVYVPFFKYAEMYLNYPYIEIPGGRQYFGLNSIKDYVEQQLAGNNGNGGNGNGKK